MSKLNQLIFIMLFVASLSLGCSLSRKELHMQSNNRNPVIFTTAQQEMVSMWEQHTSSEFKTKSITATLETMTANPHVNHVPVMTGGVGLNEVRSFYSTHFIPGQPPDTEIIPVSRTVGQDRIVDELIHKFTHTIEMPWMLPGIKPTGRHVELAVVVVVHFLDGKIESEHIYWDQASVLAQLGLLDDSQLPIGGVETARKILDPTLPSNRLIQRSGIPQ